MTRKQVEEKLTELIHRQPFEPFIIELKSGEQMDIRAPGIAFDHTGGGFIGPEGGLVDFWFKDVRDIRIRTQPEGTMTPKQVEEKLTELTHRKPFARFVVELTTGELLEIANPNVSFDDEGALFFGSDGGLVEFDFRNVRAIRSKKPGAAA
jgi:hypothetical protein